MQKIHYNTSLLSDWLTPKATKEYLNAAINAESILYDKKSIYKEYIGWLHLPGTIKKAEIQQISDVAEDVRNNSNVFICIGIGGSYLGARAAIDFLSPSFEEKPKLRIVYAGHNINSDYMSDLLHLIENKDVTINVISKSGTTTEPGIAFRVLRKFMEKKYGRKKAAQRIIATTDPQKGALRKLADEEGYTTFPIPADIGGRYSVLTPVGLLPIAAAGIDISKVIKGAKEASEFCKGAGNIAMQYAIARNILFRQGKTIEVLAGFQPQLHYICEWWKQLAGESEGKQGTGIFPASVDYTTDLHSMGQWMQDGVRNIFETFILLKKTVSKMAIPAFDDDADGFNFIAGKSFEHVNDNAYRGTLLAHVDGGVPVSTITIQERSADALGQLFYFFEKAIALSGHILRVNPFTQPGVEAYKNNMFALLKKPGYEKQSKELHKILQELKI